MSALPFEAVLQHIRIYRSIKRSLLHAAEATLASYLIGRTVDPKRWSAPQQQPTEV
jgi:hypothetical protein